jgi:hypothetical protein
MKSSRFRSTAAPLIRYLYPTLSLYTSDQSRSCDKNVSTPIWNSGKKRTYRIVRGQVHVYGIVCSIKFYIRRGFIVYVLIFGSNRAGLPTEKKKVFVHDANDRRVRAQWSELEFWADKIIFFHILILILFLLKI